MGNEDYQFKVGFSFSGDQRNFVVSVAECLVEKIGRDNIFYDEWYEGELAIPSLDKRLQDIYENDCLLIVPIFSKGYKKSHWCGVEWDAIRRVLESVNAHRIMPMTVNGVIVDGLDWSVDGHIDIQSRSAQKIASLITSRLNSMPVETITKETGLSFTNREKELKKILEGTRSYHLVLAPFKYGKTRLIHRLEEIYSNKGWIVKTCHDLNVLNPQTIVQHITNTKISIEEFTQNLKEEWLTSSQRNTKGVVFLFDLPAGVQPNAPMDILADFIKPLWSRLQDAGLKRSKFKLIVTHAPLALKGVEQSYVIHRLSEFTYDVISRDVGQYLLDKNITNQKHVKDITSKLFYDTGGYPYCINLFLNYGVHGGRQAILFNNCIDGAEQQFSGSINPKTRVLFLQSDLSCYRYIELKILSKIETEKLVKKDVQNIMSDLITHDGYKTVKQKNFASKKLIHDSMMRRVYAIKKRLNKPDDFVIACNKAAQIYYEFLEYKHLGKSYLPIWLIEYWFQLAQARQVEYRNKAPNVKQTRALHLTEITTGIDFLHQVSDKKYNECCDVLYKQIEQDWEFKFLYNYDAYEETYHKDKFSEFKRQVRIYSESLMESSDE